MDKAKSSLYIEEGYEDAGGEGGGGGAEFLCVYSGALKNRLGQGGA